MIEHAVIAYPKLAPADEAWIDQRRQVVGRVLAPHFTFVFPHVTSDETALVAHVETCVRDPIAFVVRCVLAMPEREGRASLFLVPDEGFAAIVRLHDDLYTGILAPELRGDLPFVPHITIGMIDQGQRDVVDRLNRELVAIHGTIDALDIVRLDTTATPIHRVKMPAA
jgi:2'-5' RNA ligase